MKVPSHPFQNFVQEAHYHVGFICLLLNEEKSARGLWCSALGLHHRSRQPIFAIPQWKTYPCILYQACDAHGICFARGIWCSELSLHQIVSRLTFCIPRRTAHPYFLYQVFDAYGTTVLLSGVDPVEKNVLRWKRSSEETAARNVQGYLTKFHRSTL